MSNVGTQLRQAREAQNKTRADVAGETGILIHQLTALEHGSFDALPDDETAAGFVKAYAEYLGFVADEPVAEFWAERRGGAPSPDGRAAGDEEPAPVEPSSDGPVASLESVTPPAPGPRWAWMLAAAVVVVLVGSWLAMRGGNEVAAVAVEPEETPVVETEPWQEEAAPEPDPVASDPAWPESEPNVQPPPPAPATNLRIAEHGLGSGVRDRGLTGESDRFEVGAKVWFWNRVLNGGAGDRVVHVWVHEGREVSRVELDIGSSNWRTWSTKAMKEGSAGDWAVEARDASGRVLARREFTCR